MNKAIHKIVNIFQKLHISNKKYDIMRRLCFEKGGTNHV